MKILAIETSGRAAAFAALQIDEEQGHARVLSWTELDDPRLLSRRIIAEIESTLADAQCPLEELDGIAVSLGPGSWTGLRIGVTTAKTLAQMLEIPLAGVPVFDALAQHIWRTVDDTKLPDNFLLLTGAPCRPGEIYGKIFECHPQYLAEVQTEWIGSPQLMADTLATEALARGIDATFATASVAASLAETWPERSDVPLLPAISLQDLVTEIGIAGAALIDEGENENPLALQPLYLAPSAAERNLIARGGN